MERRHSLAVPLFFSSNPCKCVNSNQHWKWKNSNWTKCERCHYHRSVLECEKKEGSKLREWGETRNPGFFRSIVHFIPKRCLFFLNIPFINCSSLKQELDSLHGGFKDGKLVLTPDSLAQACRKDIYILFSFSIFLAQRKLVEISEAFQASILLSIYHSIYYEIQQEK